MRLAKLDEELSNQKLATSIKTKDGKKLVNEGTVLSSKLIERLVSNGLNAVYIEDENDDIQLQETLNVDSQVHITSRLQSIFQKIEKNEFSSIELNRFIRMDLLPEIKKGPVSIPSDRIMEKEDFIDHSINVAILCIRMACELEFPMDKIEQMAFIALTHDIGKIIKKKNTKLASTPHYEVAYDFLKSKNCPVLTYMSVRFQEESYDGKGVYGINWDKQIDFAKILSICDYYENLLRSTELMPYECYEKTQALVNSRFDPKIFDMFRESIYIYPIGLPVLLNNKTPGIIYGQNESYPLRPIVKTKTSFYNLMENLSLFIEQVAM